ncbi:DUF2187 domain-containing protein [Bacillus wiedmannii]|uniref:DUF2187 domain-containing protein n=1 Tax=Bacillus wiedmannii TaxID=1890302 RepID=A0A4U2MA93_9BACI|nr:DUF2187 domain-containing protein [Bacillus wiedmannii]
MSSNPPLSKKEELLLWDMIVGSRGTFEFDRTIVNHKNYTISNVNTQSNTK